MSRQDSSNTHSYPLVRGRAVPVWWGLLWALTITAPVLTWGQELPGESLTSSTALERRRAAQENPPYTIKTGDLRLLLTPSLSLEYNDNINISRYDPLDDFILKPMLQLNASYPLSTLNLLRLDIGVGYDKYFNHDDYSGLRLTSGSELSFDIFVKDFRINLHDRFEYISDAAAQPAITGNAHLEYFQNTAGLTADWDLKNGVLTAGYDHLNYISQSQQFEYLNHASEIFLARAGLKVRSTLTAGLEGTSTLTRYDQPVLNDNTGYSGGLYADWRPDSFLTVQPRVGYTYYAFDQTSLTFLAQNQGSWYGDITVRHAPTEAINYSLSVGHELRPGTETDLIEDSYARPAVNWAITRDITLGLGLSYEHGRQGRQGLSGAASETYDWLALVPSLAYSLTKKFRLNLTYRCTLRSSNYAYNEYTQNVVGLQLTYLTQ